MTEIDDVVDLIGEEVDDYWHGMGDNDDVLIFRGKGRKKYKLVLHDVELEQVGGE